MDKFIVETEDKDQALMMMYAADMYAALCDIDEDLRRVLKDHEVSEEVSKKLLEARQNTGGPWMELA